MLVGTSSGIGVGLVDGDSVVVLVEFLDDAPIGVLVGFSVGGHVGRVVGIYVGARVGLLVGKVGNWLGVKLKTSVIVPSSIRHVAL